MTTERVSSGSARARVAVVTGAAGALGSEMVRRFHADGLHVVAADIDVERARALAAELDLDGQAVLPVLVDVTDYGSVEAMVAAATEWGGGVDVLINNAGVSEGVVPTWELPLEAWHRTIEIDLTGVFHGCRAVLPGMVERRWGRIVNISSIAGKEGKHNPAAYAAAKAGVIGLTKAVAFEVAEHGVLVNAITPGAIFTHNWAGMSEADIEVVRRRHPVGRLGRPEEVAALVSWLSSDECSFSTGAVFDISGGRAGH
ncbi:MAG TPA: SDR family NAD(P)-dependent oxidoreductase [Candidatus Limnocylindrales bacterium]|nr:SDR family NAD(P)-dependent oxidoreductase [Candidatus Limnocylindrales bacterium]